MGDFFNSVFVHPLLNVLVGFYKFYEQIQAPGKLGLAIITFTVFIRLVMYPLFKKQMDTTKKLNDKHKNDKQKLQQEQLRLYKEAGINPASGCLLAIVQIPVFIGLYNALNFFVTKGNGTAISEINNLLYYNALKIQSIDVNFLMYNLTLTPSQGANPYYYAIPVITGILQYFQAITTMPPLPPKKVEVVLEGKKGKKGKELDKKAGDAQKGTSTSDEFQRAMQVQMKYMFPVMIGFFSFSFPVALSLYWNVFSLFSIIQYYLSKEKSVKELTK
jgi:YidC/Oxa1 family membrane protein insertase